jgi:hypothetical protein
LNLDLAQAAHLDDLASPVKAAHHADGRRGPSAAARSRTTAVFAAPATGGAVTRRRSVVFCQPTTSSRDARG